MRKSVKNCRNLNMQTIRLRRSRPSSLAIAIALAITMLVVWLLSLQGCPKEEAQAASAMQTSAEIRMEAMEAHFLPDSIHDDRMQANVAAALCAQSGGAGIVVQEGAQFAVVREAGEAPDASALKRSCRGLTLRLRAPAEIAAAMSDGISALRALADETKALAGGLERGESDQRTIAALLNVYRTRLRNALDGLEGGDSSAIALIRSALESSLERADGAIAETLPGKLRLLHAAGCLEWISLAGSLQNLG